MRTVFDSYEHATAIPVQEHVRNKKLIKYFNRETAAAVVCAAKLLKQVKVHSEIPFYYETGKMEFEDLGLDLIADASLDEDGHFSQRLFIERGTKAVMPLTQFKALYNMPLSFVSIENGLTGENAVIYASARGLLEQAMLAPEDLVLLGSGKVHRDGKVESAFALLNRKEIADSQFSFFQGEGIEMFRSWYSEAIRK